MICCWWSWRRERCEWDMEEHMFPVSHIASRKNKSCLRLSHVSSTYLLAIGVCSHSVIIGITLGTSSSREFPNLLLALGFQYVFFPLSSNPRSLVPLISPLISPL